MLFFIKQPHRKGNAGFTAGIKHICRWVNPPTSHWSGFSCQPPEIKTKLTLYIHLLRSILATSYKRWAVFSGHNPTTSRYQEAYSIYQTDATPIWVTLHSDLFQSCWHSGAPLCIVPRNVGRRKNAERRRRMSGKTEQKSEDGGCVGNEMNQQKVCQILNVQ